ncbi:orotidine-5'-phosphate decarboxylase [Corynebacterium sp.]|uniref:orotidine-5'-phosphate decarboxylase n=1 Tax=Corynebacterium sp. TaxID=1720 RepID=UPI0025BBAEAB|nr:orotidine-5'-phosphate decarboxylase [Corynebacterium sp.]
MTTSDGTFGERYLARSRDLGRLCVGMDPHAGILESWGLGVDVAGLETFSRLCVEAFADTACVVKPQVAFYEAFGSAGLAVLERALAELRRAGTLVIADAKRGDIGSTMAGYARAWLSDDSPLCADAVTVSPYLGLDSLAPALEAGEASGRGVVVLSATSNPEGPQFQTLATPGGRSVAQSVVDWAAGHNAPHHGGGNVGVVVGATVTDPPELDDIGGVVLMPGVGAQGGAVEDIRRIAGAAEKWASPNISRSVLSAGPDVGDLRRAVVEAAAAFPQV